MSAIHCLGVVVKIAVVFLILGAVAARRLAPVGSARLGMAMGAAGGAMGGLLLHFICPVAGAAHVVLGHVGGVALSALAGAVVAAVVVRPPLSGMRVLALMAVVAGLAGCRGGCVGQHPAAEARPLAETLSWFPAETQILVSLDFARLRATPLWARLAPLAASNPDDRAQIEEFVRRTGLDPLRQIDSLVVAFPEEARNSGAMGVVLRGRGFDEARLVAYVRDQVGKQGDDLFSFRRSGRTLWATRKQPTVAGFFADARTFVLGAGGWAEKMAELGRPGAPADAETNLPLVHLVERTGGSSPIWGAALVPAATRAALAADPALPSGAGINRLGLSADAGVGLATKLVADFATREQAQHMTTEVADAVRNAKKSPQVLLMGIGPLLDGVSVRSAGVSCEISVRLSEAQVADGVERLRGFFALARQGAVPGFPHP